MSPLSELVWSPDEGLSIKIAASRLSTRKASLRWNADTLNIVLSSPQQSGGGGGKSGDNIDANLEVSEKMPSQLQTRNDSSMRVTTASPNRITNLDAMQSTSMRSQEQDSRIDVMNEGKEGSENCCVEKLEEVEAGSCPTTCCKDTSHSSASRKEVVPSTSEKHIYCAAPIHNERWATNAWRARLVKALSQKDSVLSKNMEDVLSPSSLGNLHDAGKLPGNLAYFLGNRNTHCPGNDSKEISNVPAFHSQDNRQDQALQESHKDEPIVARVESSSGGNAVARCESAFGVNARKLEKGKEKVMYNNSYCVSNTKESDNSNESIESCPGTKAPKRKHAQCSAAKLPSENKRYRREDNESACSGILQKCGGSFFNWMSSLTNGLIMLDEGTAAVPLDQKFSGTTGEGSSAPPLPLQNSSSMPLQSVGFNSLFQSLYSHNVMITSRNTFYQPESTEHVPNKLTMDFKGSNSMMDKQIGVGRETHDVATETLAADGVQMVSGGSRGNFLNEFGIFPMRAERNMELPNSSKSCSRLLEEKHNECPASCSNAVTGNKGGFAESLWVSRLLPKSSMNLMEAAPCNINSGSPSVNPKGVGNKLYCSSLQNFNVDEELNNIQYSTGKGSNNGATSSKCPAMPPEQPKQSETMASVFAKRLDALKHAKTSAVRLAISCDHGMPKRSNHRTSPFVVSYSSHDEVKPEQETCRSSSGNGKIVMWIGDKGKEQLCTRSHEDLRGNFLSECKYQHRGWSSAGKYDIPHDNLEANTSAEDTDGRRIETKEGVSDPPDNKQIVPYDIMSNDVHDESGLVLGALHRLRLSRSDIIRWLRSPIMHTALDGFFVRLRFGKWEEALGGTGYHVARISGALDRNRLSVTIRNSTCQVDSRFVSNHDFHEDELKAWWSAAIKGDWKLPSREELNMKLRERELLRS